jgi:SAM-dependent methyltransferase
MDLAEKVAACSDQTVYVPAQRLSTANRSLNPTSWQRVDHCPACRARHLRTFATIRCVRYERCRACGFTFANPIPSDQALATFYNSPFYENYRRFEAHRKVVDPYFSISFPDLRRLAQWIDLDASARILDFGCGTGSFVALLRNEYSFRNVDGLEISDAGREVALQCHGLRIASAISELSALQYDLITLIEVIEHIPRPDLLIENIADLIAPGGRLFITTDSIRNVPARFFPSYSPHFTGPSHISMFTEASIGALCSRLGLTVERIDTEPSVALLGEVVVSPFFNLDFMSPRSDDDGNDLLYVPTKLGGALGLRATRRLPKALQILKRFDRLGGRALRPLTRGQASEHLFVTVRKPAMPAM